MYRRKFWAPSLSKQETSREIRNLMKKFLVSLFAVFALLALPFQAMAVPQYNQNVTAIYGGGNPDGGWVTNTVINAGRNDTAVSLRGKNTSTGATTNNGAGLYTFTQGESWNFEFSFNTDVNGNNFWQLGAFAYSLSVDTNPSAGTSFVTFSPTLFTDNSYGDNSTGNGAGVEGSYVANALTNSIMQNSQNIGFFPYLGNQATPGTYDISASILGLTGGVVNTLSIQIQVLGANNTPGVPDGGATIGLLALSLLALGVMHHRRPHQSEDFALQAA